MTAQFGDVEIDPTFGEEDRNFTAKPGRWDFLVADGGAKNVTNFFLHAVAVAHRTTLQLRLDLVFNIAYDELRHRQPRFV